MELIAPEVYKKLMSSKALYSGIIEKLPTGAAMKLHKSEWQAHSRRESCQHYFWRVYNKGGKRKISIRKLNEDYYIVKL